MPEIFRSLSGRWFGKFEYRVAAPPVGFEAELLNMAGALTGEIREPNTFRHDQCAELFSDLNGYFAADEASFSKMYRGFVHDDHPFYMGTTNTALTRIEGRWHFPKLRHWNGRFVMIRKPQAGAGARKNKSADQDLEFTR